MEISAAFFLDVRVLEMSLLCQLICLEQTWAWEKGADAGLVVVVDSWWSEH